ncbi:MAG TPA: hypothetical protein VED45_03400 [Steroidobacteraceae bacterium]|nr:hypothetical protein [Steroidobacteraceae bacterium]
MIYLLALLPATALTIGGYLVLFVSNRSEGALRTFGKYLAFWAFTLAGLVILGALFAAAHSGHRCPPYGMRGTHGGIYGPWGGGGRFGPEGRGAPPAPPLPPAGAPNPAGSGNPADNANPPPATAH